MFDWSESGAFALKFGFTYIDFDHFAFTSSTMIRSEFGLANDKILFRRVMDRFS